VPCSLNSALLSHFRSSVPHCDLLARFTLFIKMLFLYLHQCPHVLFFWRTHRKCLERIQCFLGYSEESGPPSFFKVDPWGFQAIRLRQMLPPNLAIFWGFFPCGSNSSSSKWWASHPHDKGPVFWEAEQGEVWGLISWSPSGVDCSLSCEGWVRSLNLTAALQGRDFCLHFMVS
jgi:hypothetical protein